MVERAKVIFLANQGKSNLEMAQQLRTRPAVFRSGDDAWRTAVRRSARR